MVKQITDTIAKVTVPTCYHIYYDLLRKIGLTNGDILMMSAFLGFKKGNQKYIKREANSEAAKHTKVEVRGEYLKKNEIWIYLILNQITQNELFKNYEEKSEELGKLMNEEFLSYANGGMEILAENVLNRYISQKINLPKIEVLGLQEDLLQYLWDEVEVLPF